MKLMYNGENLLQPVIGGGIDFTVDDTLKMSEDNVLSVSMPVKVTTSDTWSTLTDLEKTGLFFVKSIPKAVGDRMDWAGYNWIVVNDNGDGTIVLAMSEIYELTQFGTNATYAGSTLAAKAKTFEESLPAEALVQAVETTVNSVTAKVFVASYEQAMGDFSYFGNQSNRIFKYNGNPETWYTSSDSGDGYCYAITVQGTGYRPKPNPNYGFLPFITIKQSTNFSVYLNGEELPFMWKE